MIASYSLVFTFTRKKQSAKCKRAKASQPLGVGRKVSEHVNASKHAFIDTIKNRLMARLMRVIDGKALRYSKRGIHVINADCIEESKQHDHRT